MVICKIQGYHGDEESSCVVCGCDGILPHHYVASKLRRPWPDCLFVVFPSPSSQLLV